jgi:V/A-type H+-transporting ATPase subunit E
LAAQLELRKYELSLKRELLNRCIQDALNQAAGMGQKDYLALIAALLKNADKGDTVIICAKDKGIITQDFLDKNSKDKLVLGKTYGDFRGGIKLVNAIAEKNLTLEALLDKLREEVEPETAGILFGGA